MIIDVLYTVTLFSQGRIQNIPKGRLFLGRSYLKFKEIFMLEFIIIVAIAAAVWFFRFKDKAKEASAEPVLAPQKATEAKSKDKPEVRGVSEATQVVNVVADVSKQEDFIPEDSALKRHYLQHQAALAEQGEQPVVVEVVAKVSGVKTVTVNVLGNVASVTIPEDATLKRHFIQQLTTEVAATMPQRPTDSSLKRHFDVQLLNAVDERLQALK